MKKYLLVSLALCIGIVLLGTACSKPAEQQRPASSSAVQEAVVVEDVKPSYTLPTEPYYVLLIGNDSRNNTVESKGNNDQGRSDTMMVMRIDPKTYQISLLTIPRDTPIRYNDSLAKINRPYLWDGVEVARDTIGEFLGIDFTYYVDMGMPEFTEFYNAIGGVDVDAAIDINLKDIMTGERIYIDAGNQHLDGNEALVFARVRKMYVWGDACRQYNSRHMIETTIKQCAEDPTLAATNLDILLSFIETDWPAEALMLQVADFCEHADQISFIEGTGPYDGSTNEETDDWMCYEDPDLWEQVVELFTAGEDPTAALPLAPMDAV